MVVVLPISIDYYGPISEEDHSLVVDANRTKLLDLGLVFLGAANQNNDRHKELWATRDLEDLRLSPDLTVYDRNGYEIEPDDFEIEWEF